VPHHQRERSEVVAGNPADAARVERIGAVAQVQREAFAVVREGHPQHRARGEVTPGGVPAGRVELGLERRPGHAQLALQLVHGELPVPHQIRLDPNGVQ
jgi:hypothetical protein